MALRVRLHLVGFGRVAKALVELLESRPLSDSQGRAVRLEVIGIATGAHGCWAIPKGLDLGELAQRSAAQEPLESWLPGERVRGTYELLRSVAGDVMVENSPLNPFGGEPAVSHVRQALRQDLHVITANKGPAACAFRELRALAEERGRAFLFESAVLGGTPVFRLVRAALPGARLVGVRGLLNSTTSYLLARIESGLSFAAALAEAQQRGIAEADPEHDVEGLDAATKLAVLVNALLDGDVRPAEVERRGISGLAVEDVRESAAAGQPIRLVASAQRREGTLRCKVAPEALSANDPLSGAGARGNALLLETDVLGTIGIVQPEPGLERTAYGLYADLAEVVWRISRV